jgi:outer membrane protein assembly factor BamD (BamD/ComL family)
LIVSACATGNVVIPQELSPAELIQRAQEASDKNKYPAALQYYEALRERNPTIAADNNNCVTNTRCCRYSCMRS